MIKESITVDEVLGVLNSAVEADRDAMERLIDARIVCNKELADHPTIQVGLYPTTEKPEEYKVGFLGMLNGLFGISDETGFGIVSALYDWECPEGCEEPGSDDYDHDNPETIACTKCGKMKDEGFAQRLTCFSRTPDKYLKNEKV